MKHSLETIQEALRASGGIVSLACQKLNIARSTYYLYEAEHPALKETRDEITEDLLDLAEAGLLQLIRGGDREAIRFILRCKGKRRGWQESYRLEGADGGPIRAQIERTVVVLPSNNRETLPGEA